MSDDPYGQPDPGAVAEPEGAFARQVESDAVAVPDAVALPDGVAVAEGGDVVAGTPVREITGHSAVDAALAQLDAVADRVPAEQVGAYEAVHRTLTGTLSGIDQS